MVGVDRVIARLHPAQACHQLGLNQVEVLHQACCLQQVEGQHGQTGPRGSLSIGKDVKLPVAFGVLHAWSQGQRWVRAGIAQVKSVLNWGIAEPVPKECHLGLCR